MAVLLMHRTIIYLIILVLGFISSCSPENSPGDINCSECLVYEPFEGALIVKVTVNSNHSEVPVVVLKGKLGSTDTVVIDTISDQVGYIDVPINQYYTVIAEYHTDTKTIFAVDGDEINKYNASDQCGGTCWIISGGIINLALKYDK